MEENENKRIIISIPIYQDWVSVAKLISQIDSVIPSIKQHYDIEVLIIDDGSEERRKLIFNTQIRHIKNINILHLRRNLGHQRAIAIGLSYIYEKKHFDATIVMDGDGEDTPEGIIKLIHRFMNHNEQSTVFAKRQRRKESLMFRFFYCLYKILHWFLTGKGIQVGNFSILSFHHVGSLVVSPELWNHYAASVVKLKLTRDLVPIDRGFRIDGHSTMNFISFVIHGLSAISVYAEEVGVRLMVACFLLIISFFIGLMSILSIKFLTELAIPGWTTNAFGISLVIIFQLLIISLIIVVITLKNRSSADFIPIRDYHYFINKEEIVYPK